MHRGLLLDSARHFLPVPLLRSALDAMTANKLNVLHWHVSDTQSAPLDAWEAAGSYAPLAGGAAAYGPRLTYSRQDVEG